MQSPTHGEISKEVMIEKIHSFVTLKDKDYSKYDITVGTDSQCFKRITKFVLVVAIHEVGHGGIYFYDVVYKNKKCDIATKIHTEVQMSIEMAEYLNDELKKWDLPNVVFNHIDIDIGNDGLTKKYIKEVAGWVNGVLGHHGIIAHIKPNAPTASCIADRISK